MPSTTITPKLRLLTKAADILAISDIIREEVATPEWGEDTGVLVQAMTAAQRLVWVQSGRVAIRDERGQLVRMETSPDWDNTVTLVICSVVDEKGEPVFSVSQLEALQAKSSAPIERIADVARRLSRLRAEDAEASSDSLKARNGGSPSGSASPSE